MKKFIILAVALFAFSGCASKGDLTALSNRVEALEANQKTLFDDHTSIKADHEAIKGDIADLTAKFDRAFAKSMKK